MVVALVANKEWYKYLVIDIFALLNNSKNIKKIYVIAETTNSEDIPYLNKIMQEYKDVKFVIVNANNFIEKNIKETCCNKQSFFTKYSFVKLMLSDIVEEEKVLYIDTDAIVKKDISNLWKYDITDYYIAGVKDFGIYKRGRENIKGVIETYINSGFVLFNLKKMRADNIQEKLLDIVHKMLLRYPDQDALNLVCHQKIMFLPSMYNLCEDVTLDVVNKNLVKVYHYAGVKNFWVANRLYAEEWYEEEEKFYDRYGWPTQGGN